MIESTPVGALHGINVIDLTQMLAGPFATMLLADQGADVIKIEPIGGEHSRAVGPFLPDDNERHYGGYFASVNRNKKSICVDLKSEEGLQVVRKLVESADVLVENFRVGVMDRLGLSYETLREVNPRLVYASIRGFGDPRTGESPYANWPAYDVVAQAMGGIISITGPNAQTPTKIGPGIGDLIPGALTSYGIVCAVLRAQKTNRGQYVDVSMVDSVLAFCERILHQHSYQGIVPAPEGNRHPLVAPFGILPAKDGLVAVAATKDGMWKTLCEQMGRSDLLIDPRLSTFDARSKNHAYVYEVVSAFTLQHTKSELIDILGGKIPFGPVWNTEDIVNSTHFRSRDMIVEMEHPGSNKKVFIAGVPVRMSETQGRIYRRAPLVGEDTDQLLGHIGYSSEEIRRLRDHQVIG